MKIVLIIPYYGKFPNYFQLFLDSCGKNPAFNWLIFTDDKTPYRFPDNVNVVYNSFAECRERIQSKFDFPVLLTEPQKLCDYKCAYGFIFEDYLKDVDFWGYCDVDVIFGRLDYFITEELLNNFDKIFSLGRPTLYRNTSEINRVFMNEFNGKKRYKEVFQTNVGCAFDEWYPENINDIFRQTHYRLKLDNLCADIESYKTRFILNTYNLQKKTYEHMDQRNMIFEYIEGHIFQIVKENKSFKKKEYPYLHLQKRNMSICINVDTYEGYYIVPNRFVPLDSNILSLFRKNLVYEILNFQFFKVKYKSLKLRIKRIKLKRQGITNDT